ncbi:MAG: SRPBCC family protein [Alphaproteobacteria bacterium]
MATVKVDTVLDVSADAAWAVLADFGGFLNWAGDGSSSAEIEGDGVGMIRHLEMPGIGKFGEQLTVLDHDSKTLAYKIAYGAPLGMASYGATVTLQDKGDGTCAANWIGEFEGGDEAAISEGLKGSYAGMSDSLAAYVKEQ